MCKTNQKVESQIATVRDTELLCQNKLSTPLYSHKQWICLMSTMRQLYSSYVALFYLTKGKSRGKLKITNIKGQSTKLLTYTSYCQWEVYIY